ncbi:hypothetical protein SAMN03159332_6365 [Paenibacillus sp. 276b]|nr:hypothetical protein SAMN03159332_6365 [Paenibacillus sp. 276b]
MIISLIPVDIFNNTLVHVAFKDLIHSFTLFGVAFLVIVDIHETIYSAMCGLCDVLYIRSHI